MKSSFEYAIINTHVKALSVLERSNKYGCRKKDETIKTVSYTRERASEKTEDMLTNIQTVREHQNLCMLGS